MDAGGSYLVGYVKASSLPDKGSHGQSGSAGNELLDFLFLFIFDDMPLECKPSSLPCLATKCLVHIVPRLIEQRI